MVLSFDDAQECDEFGGLPMANGWMAVRHLKMVRSTMPPLALDSFRSYKTMLFQLSSRMSKTLCIYNYLQ